MTGFLCVIAHFKSIAGQLRDHQGHAAATPSVIDCPW
jgi:hypothetical protein